MLFGPDGASVCRHSWRLGLTVALPDSVCPQCRFSLALLITLRGRDCLRCNGVATNVNECAKQGLVNPLSSQLFNCVRGSLRKREEAERGVRGLEGGGGLQNHADSEVSSLMCSYGYQGDASTPFLLGVGAGRGGLR